MTIKVLVFGIPWVMGGQDCSVVSLHYYYVIYCALRMCRSIYYYCCLELENTCCWQTLDLPKSSRRHHKDLLYETLNPGSCLACVPTYWLWVASYYCYIIILNLQRQQHQRRWTLVRPRPLENRLVKN